MPKENSKGHDELKNVDNDKNSTDPYYKIPKHKETVPQCPSCKKSATQCSCGYNDLSK
jgi:hypothetical protein